MNTEKHTAIVEVVMSGTRTAYYLDNPNSIDVKFEKWLAVALAREDEGIDLEILRHLVALCRRALEGKSRTHIHTLDSEKANGVRLALSALEEILEDHRATA